MNYVSLVQFTGRKEKCFLLYAHIYRIEWEVMEWIEMARHVVQWWAVVGGVTILLFLHPEGNFMIT